jgi:hypothetical protein
MNIAINTISVTAYGIERTSQDEEVTYSFLQKAHFLVCNTLNVLLKQLILLDAWDLELVILFQQGESSAAISHL